MQTKGGACRHVALNRWGLVVSVYAGRRAAGNAHRPFGSIAEKFDGSSGRREVNSQRLRFVNMGLLTKRMKKGGKNDKIEKGVKE